MPWRSITKFIDHGALATLKPNPLLRDQVSTFIKGANAGQVHPWTPKPFITKEYVQRSGTMQQALNELAKTARIATPCRFHVYSQDRYGPLLQPILFTRTWIQAHPWNANSAHLLWISVLQVLDSADATDRSLMKRMETTEHAPYKRRFDLYERIYPLPLRSIWYIPPLGVYGPTEQRDILPTYGTIVQR